MGFDGQQSPMWPVLVSKVVQGKYPEAAMTRTAAHWYNHTSALLLSTGRLAIGDFYPQYRPPASSHLSFTRCQ